MSRTMAETLEYRFKEDTTRGTPLEVTGPKALIDGAISSTRGPLFRDITAPLGYSLMGRRVDAEGSVTLDFSLSTNGRLYVHGPSRVRSAQTLAIIAQLDGYAQRHDAGDPRITIGALGTATVDAPEGRTPDRNDFRVSFARPEGDIENLAARMQRAMVRTADVLHMYNQTDHSGSAEVTVAGDGGLKVRMGIDHTGMFIMESDPKASANGDRIELVERKAYSEEEQLVTICGVVAALPDVTA